MKRCIFHYPQPIENKPGVGSALRPNKMIAAFRNIGYQVDEVTGYGADRAKKIAQIKSNIKNGVKYDFMYSESVNIPTLLAEQNHIPRYPFLDFSFFRFCKKHGIPIGLFYRDMHWKFPVYTESVARWKQAITIPLFRYDLYQYQRTLDVLYVASEGVAQYVPISVCKTLPPGGVLRTQVLKRREEGIQKKDTLHIFYVGNVMGVYDVKNLCRAVTQTESAYLTICTPRESWEQRAAEYASVLCDRITVVHATSDELQPYYEAADVFACCMQTNEYLKLAMPIKVFEAITYGTPVMITEGIAAADLVTSLDCGWVVPNHAEGIRQALCDMLQNPEEIARKAKNTIAVAPNHTWECRAQQVADDLTAIKKKERSS